MLLFDSSLYFLWPLAAVRCHKKTFQRLVLSASSGRGSPLDKLDYWPVFEHGILWKPVIQDRCTTGSLHSSCNTEVEDFLLDMFRLLQTSEMDGRTSVRYLDFNKRKIELT